MPPGNLSLSSVGAGTGSSSGLSAGPLRGLQATQLSSALAHLLGGRPSGPMVLSSLAGPPQQGASLTELLGGLISRPGALSFPEAVSSELLDRVRGLLQDLLRGDLLRNAVSMVSTPVASASSLVLTDSSTLSKLVVAENSDGIFPFVQAFKSLFDTGRFGVYTAEKVALDALSAQSSLELIPSLGSGQNGVAVLSLLDRDVGVIHHLPSLTVSPTPQSQTVLGTERQSATSKRSYPLWEPLRRPYEVARRETGRSVSEGSIAKFTSFLRRLFRQAQERLFQRGRQS